MKTTMILLLALAGTCVAFTGDDKFIKKYAMMKVYESCFGQEVVKEVRKEMKAAASKCAGISASGPGGGHMPVKLQTPPGRHPGSPHSPQHKIHSQIHTILPADPNNQLENQPEAAALHSPNPPKNNHPTLDLDKLQQAILAGYNKHATQQQQSFSTHQQQSFAAPQPYRPAPSYYQPPPPSFNSLYYPQPQQMYQPPQYMPNPYYQPPMYPYQQQPYFSGRSSRDLDVRGQLETLNNRMSGRIRNVTCVMQELGYLDFNLEPDYGRMIERIGRLPVTEELKRDMAEGVEFCRQFSQCVPEDKKDKLVREMVRPMFFFRCYKHKKLEACIMKDVRDRYNHSDEMTEDNLTGGDSRSAKEFPEDNMASAIYEFLYGGDNIDIDTLL